MELVLYLKVTAQLEKTSWSLNLSDDVGNKPGSPTLEDKLTSFYSNLEGWKEGDLKCKA